MITFTDVLRAIHRADRLRTAVSIVAASTLLTMYVEQLQRAKRRCSVSFN